MPSFTTHARCDGFRRKAGTTWLGLGSCNTVIASVSEAIQAASKELDCFADARNDVDASSPHERSDMRDRGRPAYRCAHAGYDHQTQLRILATHCARVLQIHSPPKDRGRREDRVRAAPEVSCAKANKKTHMSIQVQRKQSGLPCAMALRLISCSPRRDLACLSPSPPRSVSFSRT
jgi:hypothetical protein